jgi:hypothetical protein
MNKMIISEDRLLNLVRESIYEVLQEEQYDEGFGHWLGDKYQSARNGVRNFVNDFRAGQNNARERNKDYNPYEIYGERENDVRRMGNGAYPDYRYNLEKTRNQAARGETEPQNTETQTNITAPHPSLTQQNKETDNTQQNQIKNNSVAQTRGNNGFIQFDSKEQNIELNRVSNELKKNGIEPIMKNGKIVNFRPLNGKMTPEQKALIQQTKRNPVVSKFLMENEIEELKLQLNELMDSYKKISRK